MTLLVQKYGGTSVGSPERIQNVAERIVRTRRGGADLVVVVSAMGDATDDLIDLARQVSTRSHPREMDMLLTAGERISMALVAMAVNDRGQEAVSFTGSQSGIVTDASHTQAKILEVKADRIREELKRGRIVIVAGFQGVSKDREVTTLGRGGSDTTAVALAAALEASECEIYTDVDGVYTADPRIVEGARKLTRLSYDEMLELASLGANVLHNRSVDIARRFQVPIHVRSSFNWNEGSRVARGSTMEQVVIRGIAHDKDVAKVALVGVPDRPGVASEIFQSIGGQGVNVRMIVQASGQDGKNDVTFTVGSHDVNHVLPVLEEVRKKIGARAFLYDPDVAMLSVVGEGLATSPGTAGRVFQALAQAGVNIDLISTSSITITCVVRQADAERAVRSLHEALELEREP
ncbi:MAG: aspartate kinase [Candidatus Eisenbacteria bacterium]|uniref:Aspartokinase n=1 Tax=Eiseniibacteriota bacterium TaxID=2212470 RepID=A0A538SU68_UNCEI|nr:MAG: aspartate kinase [Candidatus Eisenbacteria bacterium]